jgi:hypothetical protein
MVKMDVEPVRPSIFAALFFLATGILVLSCAIGYLIRILYIKKERYNNDGGV